MAVNNSLWPHAPLTFTCYKLMMTCHASLISVTQGSKTNIVWWFLLLFTSLLLLLGRSTCFLFVKGDLIPGKLFLMQTQVEFSEQKRQSLTFWSQSVRCVRCTVVFLQMFYFVIHTVMLPALRFFSWHRNPIYNLPCYTHPMLCSVPCWHFIPPHGAALKHFNIASVKGFLKQEKGHPLLIWQWAPKILGLSQVCDCS